ncbi:hypothetical protein BH11MYX2_BH11MYX2_10710 [soil metagenome]
MQLFFRTSLVLAILAGTLGIAHAQVAPAKDPVGTPAAPTEPPPTTGSRIVEVKPSVSLSHKGQIELSLRTSLGYRAIVAYDSQDYCGESDTTTAYGNSSVCTGRAPWGFDIEAGYGVGDRVDLILEMRLGVETDFRSTNSSDDAGPHLFHLAPGARFFFADAGVTKLFTTAQAVFDFAGYKDSSGSGRGFDFGVRSMNGLWFDLERGYGAYFYAGPTLMFKRWLEADMEIGAGFQARFL